MSAVSGKPRVFSSPGEFAGDVAAVVRRAGPLAAVFLRGGLDGRERERIMLAVSRVNACRSCTFVHFRQAPPNDVAAAAALHLSPAERATVEAVAWLMALANLSANTAEAILASRKKSSPDRTPSGARTSEALQEAR